MSCPVLKHLGEIAESVEYGVTASATWEPRGPKFLRITDIQDGAVDWDLVPWCECNSRSASNARLAPGDIVFARTGATTGKSFLIRDCPPESVFASYLIRVRLRDSVDPRFVNHYFQTPSYWAQIVSSARGVAQPGVNATSLKSLAIPLPPLSEQQRIAAILDEADALRAKRRVALALFDTLTQSIFLDMFGDPVRNPGNLPCVTLASLVRDNDTINYGVVQPGDDVPDGIPLVRVGDLLAGGVRPTMLKKIAPAIESTYKRSRLRGDEILVSCVGTIGVVALADERIRGYNIARAVARIPASERVDRQYLATYLRTEHVQRYFTAELRTVSQPTLNIKQLSETSVLLPPLNLQKAFAMRVAAVERLKESHFEALDALDALFASLQDRAFRGAL